ncbi:APH(3')-II family aminoglycoside O-phosphotransferase [Phreatobacter stygius]|uniref:Aminoglycoside 3'-phosphotransferase n=1 Tax=Phreatobacter stygius TaxID=1940610 RepID=A0A4D7B5S2_9HYPH|nr:APH(3') family aminoglycoside O-phosphotransferase [Phreatobacter stygius]QCI63582.1 aminoglycoside 3'-phosphotransferase [Phreatobacter stygius]
MPEADIVQPTIPPAWAERLGDYAWLPQTIGRSDAAVFRLEAGGRPILFAKAEAIRPLAELPGEIARLGWLATRGVACPRVLGTHEHAGWHWLLMSALPGPDLASAADMPPARRVEIAAGALRRLHGLDTADCPFDHRLDHRLAAARARMAAGLVDETDFDDERLGRPLPDLYRQLIADRPPSEMLVVTHGDACLPNLIAGETGFAGFIDCGRLGLADRYQDLALASWSITYNLGAAWVAPFFGHYGLPEPDPARLAYYRLLDEFF